MRQAVARLRILSLFTIGVLLAGWMTPLLVSGKLLEELSDVYQWSAPVLMLACSVLMLLAIASQRVNPPTIVILGLVYQVVVSYAIVLSEYWNTFSGLAAADIFPDRIGRSSTAVWMIFFTVLVPTQPRRALVALTTSATAVPVMYLLLVRVNDPPALDPGVFFLAMVMPYIFVIGAAYVASRIIYRLGQDVRHAQEMGSYRLEKRLGRGGMGEVWKATHRMLARPAAIKLIRSDAVGSDPTAIEAATQRFEREAQATALLRSQHTVELYDFGTAEDGTLYYVMELLDGIDLDRLIRDVGPMEPSRVVYLLEQACSSLGEAHQRGLIHRDIKPANLYVCRQGLEHDVLKVLDFGLVRRRTRIEGAPAVTMSQMGAVVGTPSFMAPEMALGSDDVDGRADLYALGCVAFWMLTGRTVFEGDSMGAMLMAHVKRDPDPPSQHAPYAISNALDRVVLRCLAKDPADRFATAQDLATALNEVGGPPWTSERAAGWWVEHQQVVSPTPS